MPSSPTRQKRRYAWSLPPHRHAAPSAPWPWINLHDEVDSTVLNSGTPPIPPICNHETCNGCWRDYPRSRFPNWTDTQVRRSGIYKAIHRYKELPCTIYHVDIDKNGVFGGSGRQSITEETKDGFWVEMTRRVGRRDSVIYRPSDLRLRALFVENMSGPVLQMLGAKYNIEPFFFSSSLNWIPSRFQEEAQEGKGDHITITLTFLRTKPFLGFEHESHTSSGLRTKLESGGDDLDEEAMTIDTERPLYLEGDEGTECSLIIDLLSVHLIRNVDRNTVISYHHTGDDATSALDLYHRLRLAGKSVYWQNIFQNTPDPTFILLVFLWYAMYAWDEALERLYDHICWIESQVMNSSASEMHVIYFGRHLHVIRAHHLHYSSLLDDFRKSVDFIWNTPNPAMDSPLISQKDRFFSRVLLEKECNNLNIEIGRLDASRSMQDNRLKNLMNVVFSTVSVANSERMEELTEAAVRDSAGTCFLLSNVVSMLIVEFVAMKQIAYLSMIFLPLSLVAAIFGMNVKELNGTDDGDGPQGTLAIYFGIALSLTVLTVWILMAVQSKNVFHDDLGNYVQESTFWERLAWPIFLFRPERKRHRDDDN
ncbi:hypothetical protein D9758_010088 [Tetrapyrgos nigripes]|uniref:Uncharacterized protein n=1 Tax=Tetrapyrgos nigripes TaxID=182062 RepID=A0A8H5CS33_9AGAR|nr:hypothetical protein D9758_010088 [Tetrapyrgos nigripes]